MKVYLLMEYESVTEKSFILLLQLEYEPVSCVMAKHA
jgi:hypothetical protein